MTLPEGYEDLEELPVEEFQAYVKRGFTRGPDRFPVGLRITIDPAIGAELEKAGYLERIDLRIVGLPAEHARDRLEELGEDPESYDLTRWVRRS